MLARLSNLHSKILKTTALAITMLAAVGTGLTFAATSIPDEDGMIHSCYLNTRGTLRVVADESECGGGETALHWSQNGTGNNSTTYGLVLSDGTLVTTNSNGVVAAYQSIDRHTYCAQLTTPPKVVTATLVNYATNGAQGSITATIRTPATEDAFTTFCNADNSNVIFVEHNGPPVADFDFVAF